VDHLENNLSTSKLAKVVDKQGKRNKKIGNGRMTKAFWMFIMPSGILFTIFFLIPLF